MRGGEQLDDLFAKERTVEAGDGVLAGSLLTTEQFLELAE